MVRMASSAALVAGLVRAPRDLRQVPEGALEDRRDVLVEGARRRRQRCAAEARATGDRLEVLLGKTFAFEGGLRIRRELLAELLVADRPTDNLIQLLSGLLLVHVSISFFH